MNGGINDIATRKELSVEEHKQRALHILLEVASFCDENELNIILLNHFVSVRLFPYLLVWLDWLSELFLIQQ